MASTGVKPTFSRPEEEDLPAAGMMGRWRTGARLAPCPFHRDSQLGPGPRRNNWMPVAVNGLVVLPNHAAERNLGFAAATARHRVGARPWPSALLAAIILLSPPAFGDTSPAGKIQLCRAAHTYTVLDQATVIVPKGTTFLQAIDRKQGTATRAGTEIATREDAKLTPGRTCATVSAVVVSGHAPVRKGMAFTTNDSHQPLVVLNGPQPASIKARPPVPSTQPNNPYAIDTSPKPQKWTVNNLALVTAVVSDFH